MKHLPTLAPPRCVALLGLGALALTAAPAAAGPWVRDPGHAYVKLGASRFTADEGFNQGVSTGLAYEGITSSLYAEVGLPARLQLVAELPFVLGVNRSEAGVNYHNRTLGDSRLQLDWGAWEGLPLTLSLDAKLPLYTPLARQGADAQLADFPQSATRFPDPGDGNIDLTPKVQYGHSFHPLPAWATAELGYRARLGGFTDGLWAAAGAGWFVWPEHVALGVYGNAVINLGQDDDPMVQATREFVYLQGYLLLTAAPWVKDLGLTLSAGVLPWARNAAAGRDLGLGISYAY